MNRKQIIFNILLGLFIGLICVLLWLHFTDWEQIKQHLTNLSPIYLVSATCFYLLSYVLRSGRLYALVQSSTHHPSLSVHKNIAYVFACNLLNYIIPRAGEVGKGLFYKQNHQINWSDSLPCIVVDKIFDTFAIFVVLALLPFTAIVLSPALKTLIILLLLLFFIEITILIFSAIAQKRVVFILHKLFFFLPRRLSEKIYSFISLFVAGIASLQTKKKALTIAGAYTLLAALTDALFFISIFWALGVSIPFVYVLCGYTLIFLSYAMPHPPAQIGSNEMIMMVVFTIGFGYDKNQMGSVMATSHLLTMAIIFITGSFSLWYGGFRYIDFTKSKET